MDCRQILSAGAGMAAASLFSRGTGGVGVEVEPRWNDVLIVYLTRTGNTRAVAEIVRE